MTALDLSFDLPASFDLSDRALDLSVVTIESLVARDISAFSERNRRTTDRAGARVISPASA